MQISVQFERGLLLFLAIVIFPAVKIATALDAGSQPATVTNHASGDEIPVGFKLERYDRVWEHNPFTLVAPASPQARRSVFDKLVLTSWLKDGRTDVIYVQNSETNEAQKITPEPNQDNLRLIALRLNPSPQLVEAVISDGKEEGSVKFRFDAQSPAGQSAAPASQTTNSSASARSSDPAQADRAQLVQPQLNQSDAQTSALPASVRPGGSGRPKTQMQGGQRPGPRGESEGQHLPRPGQTSG